MKKIMKHKQALEPRKRKRNAYKAPTCTCSNQQLAAQAILGSSQR
jgi:hypothetical protein